MGEVRTFLQCVGEAAVAAGPDGLLHLQPGGPYLTAVADETMRRLRARLPAAELPGAVEEVARCPPPEVKLHAADIVEAVAAGRPAPVCRALTLFLFQVPPTIRQALQRSDDPAGVRWPAAAPLQRGADLLPILPGRLPMFQPGETAPADDRWVLRDLLGVGGFGEVWKAQHRDSPSMFAAFKFCTDPTARRRLLAHEGTVVSQVMRHGRVAGIVPLLDADIHADPPWLRYEYIEGGDLAGVLRTWMQTPGRKRVGQAHRIAARLAWIVGHFHRARPPVIHRDLKPANILVHKLGPGKVDLRVADFGIGDIAARGALDEARVATVANVALPTQLRGAHTPRYASPQQKRGEPPDVRDDVFALGVIWYQLLVQDLSREAPSGLDWADELRGLGVSQPFLRLLGECLSASADRRPADGAVLAERLRDLLEAGADEPAAGTTGAVGTARAAEPALLEPILLLEPLTPVARPAEPARPSHPRPARPVETAQPVRKDIPVARPARLAAPKPPTRPAQPARSTRPARRGRGRFLLAGLAGLMLALLIPAALFYRPLRDLSGALLGRGGPDLTANAANAEAPEPPSEVATGTKHNPPGGQAGDGNPEGGNEPPPPSDAGGPSVPPVPPGPADSGNLPPPDGPREAVASATGFDGPWKATLRHNGVEQGAIDVVVAADKIRLADDARGGPLVSRFQLQPILVTKFRPSQGIKLNYEGVLVVPGATHENWVDFEVRGPRQMTMYCPPGDDFPAACRGLTIEFTR